MGIAGTRIMGKHLHGIIFLQGEFYPVCPATSQYVLGAPLLVKTTLHFENGKTVIINAPANSDRNIYVKDLHWNNK